MGGEGGEGGGGEKKERGEWRCPSFMVQGNRVKRSKLVVGRCCDRSMYSPVQYVFREKVFICNGW